MQSKLYFKNLFILSSIFYLLLIVTNQYHSLDVSTTMGFFDQAAYLKIIKLIKKDKSNSQFIIKKKSIIFFFTRKFQRNLFIQTNKLLKINAK